MRCVIEGTQGSPITVRPSDFSGTNHDFSYFRRVRLTGDWAGHSLRYLDLVQSKCNADLRNAKITGFDTWKTDCENIRISPRQADTCSFDIVRAFIMARGRQYMTNVMGADAVDIDELWNPTSAEAITDRNKGDWRALIADWQVLLKTTKAQMHAMFAVILDDLPNMTQAHRGNPASFVQELKVWKLDPDDDGYTIIPESSFTPAMNAAIQKHDRWALARAAETAGPVPLVAMCRRLNPGFDLVAAPRAMLSDPSRWGMHIDGNTPAQRLRTLIRESFLFGPVK